MGGGRREQLSILEAHANRATNRAQIDWRYVEEARKGDHICYISNLRKFQSHIRNGR